MNPVGAPCGSCGPPIPPDQPAPAPLPAARAGAGLRSPRVRLADGRGLWSYPAERPCHLLVASGGSGGVHAYWKLGEPLPARYVQPDGVETEPIERAHDRIIRALGVDASGGPDVAARSAGNARG